MTPDASIWSAPQLTILGFGGAPIGNLYASVNDDDADLALEAAWDGGVRYFDTAPHYGLGLSERRLGAFLSNRARSDYCVSTKVGRLLERNPRPSGSDLDAGGFAVPDDLTRVFDYTWSGVRRCLEGSMSRLGVDYLDIVYVHDPDEFMDVAIREAIPSLIALREQGVIGAIGAGMNDWRPLLRFVEACDVDIMMLAGRWTLLDRSGLPLLDACSERGVAIAAAAPFNSGILSRPTPAEDATFNYERAAPNLQAKAIALADLCTRFEVELPHVALKFPLRHPAVATVVVGVRNAEEAQSDTEWLSRSIPEELWFELDQLEANW
jgi:D-threo-aldose 1-dehydrogenase